MNSFNKSEADIHNLCYYLASRGHSRFLRLIMSSNFVLKVNTKQNKTYFVLFSLSLFGLTMALKCTYVSVAKQNFRGSIPPDPVGEVRNLEDGPETRMER